MTDKPLDITYDWGISKHPVLWSVAALAFVAVVAWFIVGGAS